MHPTFQIVPQSSRVLQYEQCKLIIDAGQNHFSFAVQLIGTNEFVALEYYQFKVDKQEELKQLMTSHNLLQQEYGVVEVFYNNANGLLIPDRYFQEDHTSQWLELVNGDLHEELPLQDRIAEMEVRHVYSVPPALHEELVRKYPIASFSHFNTGWLKKKFRHTQKSTVMEVVLYPSHIIVSFWKEDRLLIIQCFEYDTPEDVAWCLLNVTSQWEMEPAGLPVVVSGLVEIQSPMYAEIKKYFLDVELDARPADFQYDFSFDNYPQHFFSPIFSLALCGS